MVWTVYQPLTHMWICVCVWGTDCFSGIECCRCVLALAACFHAKYHTAPCPRMHCSINRTLTCWVVKDCQPRMSVLLTENLSICHLSVCLWERCLSWVHYVCFSRFWMACGYIMRTAHMRAESLLHIQMYYQENHMILISVIYAAGLVHHIHTSLTYLTFVE